MRKLLIAGNWKMNKDFDEAIEFTEGISNRCGAVDEVDIALFPPATYLKDVSRITEKNYIVVGAQNIHSEDDGAFTGEISAKMVLTSGCGMVILGHSERRHIFGETSGFICSKIRKALNSCLTPVLCIGEKIEQRDAGETERVLDVQLTESLEGIEILSPNEIIIAYEPVWDIGTGRTATPEQAQNAHLFIRDWLVRRYGERATEIRILYGGSVKPSNAEDLLSQPDIDGALIGGASLDLEKFSDIIDIGIKITGEDK